MTKKERQIAAAVVARQLMSDLTVDISQGIATITLNRPRVLNVLTRADYVAFANALRAIDARDDVLVTVWQAVGKWFCAGTDINSGPMIDNVPTRKHQTALAEVVASSTDCSRALYTQRKLLVAALNGPVIGIAAAFLGHFDFIYCMPGAWLSVPFTFIGIVAEAGSSVSFVNRMGLAKANEVLLWGKKKEPQELLECGFVNKIYPSQSVDSFHSAVRMHLLAELEGLDPVALLATKKLIRAGLTDKNNPDAVNLRESYEQAERFITGVPSERFSRLARKEIKHKL